MEQVTSNGASDMTEPSDEQRERSAISDPIRSSERSPMPESRCDVLWTRARVVLAD